MSGRHSLRRFVPWLVLLIGWLVTGLLWQALRHHFEADARAPLQHNQDTMVLSLSQAISDRLAGVRQLARSMDIAPDHAGELFAAGGQRLLRRFPDLVALEWAVTVPDSARELVEQSLSAAAGQYVTINDYIGPGQSRVAPKQPQYLVVQHVLPANADQGALGLNLYSVPFWQTALTEALDKHEARATAASTLQNNGQHQYAVRIFVPINGSVSHRPESPALLCLVFKPASMAAGLLRPLLPDGVSTAVYDLDQFTKQPLFTLPENSPSAATSRPLPTLHSTLEFAGRHWLVLTTPTRHYILHDTQLMLEAIVLCGLVLSVLVTLLVHRLTRAYQRIETETGEQRRQWRRDQQALQNKEIEKAVLVRALSDCEQRNRDFIDLATSFSCELDEEGRIGFMSSQIHDILGIPPASLEHRPLIELLPEAEQPRFQAALDASRRDRHSVRLDTLMLDSHEQALPVGLRLRPVADAINQCQGFRAVGWALPSVVLDQAEPNQV
ncbi:CHASE domain-containing protein [Mangrovitalea sediminis]|uniref:CHASE domain-containing protein n=1 Tax=Mangrovitalea sediminis TaxID=1982043 RepID=UPI000BE53AA9|nr:CHASE domain-containing protein [Mangrovitalea sediminis]